jgi:hypothetical protein
MPTDLALLYPITSITRLVERRTWYGRRVVTTEVALTLGNGWREVLPSDLPKIEALKEAQRKREHSNIGFNRGDIVRANQYAGFHQGAEGVVMYQEPNGGRVWVRRVGTDADVFYWTDEIDLIRKTPVNYDFPKKAKKPS